MAIYLPMLCELPIAMLACARIGAVHSVIFGGFSSGAALLSQCSAHCQFEAVKCSCYRKLEHCSCLPALCELLSTLLFTGNWRCVMFCSLSSGAALPLVQSTSKVLKPVQQCKPPKTPALQHLPASAVRAQSPAAALR